MVAVKEPTGRVAHDLHGVSSCCMLGESRAGRRARFDRINRGLYSASCVAVLMGLFD